MKSSHLSPTLVFLPLVLLAPTAWAQDAAEAAMPNPKTAAHDVFKPYVGTWNCKVKMTEAGQEMDATEKFEIVCNGLWLKSVVDSTYMGQPFHGISLVGYSPKDKTYHQVWADSMSPAASTHKGTYDSKTKTLAMTKLTGEGATRSTQVWKDADTIVETAYATGADGKETVVMEITRKRGAPVPAAPSTEPANTTQPTAGAKSNKSKTASEEAISTTGKETTAASDPAQTELTKYVGKWDIVLRMPTPDGKMGEDKGTEICTSINGGHWLWTDFNCSAMGGFEGHALVAYDPSTRKVTNYWIDSTSPYMTALSGTYDPKTKAMTSSGTTIDAGGNEGTMTESVTWKDPNTRVNAMSVTSPEGTMKFEIVSTRAKQNSAPKK